MVGSGIAHVVSGRRRTTPALLAAGALIATACSCTIGQPDCSDGLRPYKGKCLSSAAIQYVGCTEGRGISPTTEIGGAVSGDLRVVADASLSLAYKRTEQENTPVALQIVKDCLELSKTSGSLSPQEQSVATDFQRRADDFRRQWEAEQLARTPTLTTSAPTARKGAQVRVSGTRFQANEMVTVRLHTTQVAQPTADGNGAFSVSITVPQDAPPAGFSTSIIATGRTSSRSASAPFSTAP
jgi:hypothetical protein